MNNVLIADVCSLWAVRFLCPHLEEVEFDNGRIFYSELSCDPSEHPFCRKTDLETVLKSWPKVKKKLLNLNDCFLTLLSMLKFFLDDWGYQVYVVWLQGVYGNCAEYFRRQFEEFENEKESRPHGILGFHLH